MTDMAPMQSAHPARRWQFWVFVLGMLALTVLFLGLAKWHMDRLTWKNQLVATVAANMDLPPAPLPPATEWSKLDPDTFQYRPVSVTGHYVGEDAIKVFVGLSDAAKGQYSGPGYWIMNLFAIDGGGSVFIDRGFVPQNAVADYISGANLPRGTITLGGVAVATEAAGPFTPPPDQAKRTDWVRDIGRMATMVSAREPVAPVYIDLPAGPRGSLPQGGETSIDYSNNHLGYIYTWLGFALTTIIMLAEWIRRQWMRGKSDGPA